MPAQVIDVRGELLPPEQWQVVLQEDGTAHVCVTHVNRRRNYYSVMDVRKQSDKLC